MRGRQQLVGLLVLVLGCADGSAPAGPLPPPEANGAAIYEAQCASCHGSVGQGRRGPAIFGRSDRDVLIAEIDETMPYADPAQCTGICAEAVADYVMGLDGVLDCDSPAFAPRRLRLLNRREYTASLRDLLSPALGNPTTPSGPDPCVDGTTFTYDPEGRSLSSVSLAGSFNGWDPGAWPMRFESGVWTLTRVVPEGSHQYKFVLDGTEWIADPSNPDRVDDTFGGFNSVVTVECAGDPGTPGDPTSVDDVARSFPVENRPEGHPFDNVADLAVVTAVYAQEHANAAKRVAETLVGEKVVDLVECDGDDLTCADRFVRVFGRRAFRRPLSDDEVTRFTALATTGSRSEGWRLALRAMISSPHFLYRAEIGEDLGDGRHRLTGWEMASLLSYTLLGTTPDDSLLDAAAAGELDDAEGVRGEAERLLADPRARESIGRFGLQWLGVEELGELPRNLDPATRAALLEETERFVTHVVLDGSGRFVDLLTADFTIANDVVASHYGLSGGSDWAETTLPEERRAGVLGHGSLHARYAHSDQSSPIQRGVFIRQRILCQEFAPPPPDAGGVPDVDPTATTRERFRQHTEEERCASCHQYIDDLGFGFERFDENGRYREMEAGNPIDSSGVLRDVEGFGTDSESSFTTLPELGAQLAESDSARGCFARQWWRFTLGAVEREADDCTLAGLEHTFEASGGDVRSLLVHLLTSDVVRIRQ